MDTINVLLLSALGDDCISQIGAVSPRLKITDASQLVIQPPFLAAKKERAADEKLDVFLAEAEILFGLRFLPDILTRAPKLKWIQTMSAGVENILSAEVINSPIILTNVSGIHTLQITELVFGMILTFAKHLPQCLENQKNKKWERISPEILHGKTLGIMGLGSIGSGVARMGKAFGMRVVGIRRTARKITRARYADVVFPREQMDRFLEESDYVVLALPYTTETDKMIGEKELSRMKPSAFLVNIGRGKTVDEEALIRALRENRIGGAGLDTYATEPLPVESPLWEMPNVIMTPHIAGAAGDYAIKATHIFCENLKRYLVGKRLINIVDKKHGY